MMNPKTMTVQADYSFKHIRRAARKKGPRGEAAPRRPLAEYPAQAMRKSEALSFISIQPRRRFRNGKPFACLPSFCERVPSPKASCAIRLHSHMGNSDPICNSNTGNTFQNLAQQFTELQVHTRQFKELNCGYIARALHNIFPK